MYEGKLPALEEHAAIGIGEAPAALGTVGNDLTDSQLAGERLALGFEVDAGREALELTAAGLGTAQLRNHRGKIAARLHRRLLRLIRIGLGLGVGRLGLGQSGLALWVEQIGNSDPWKRLAGRGNQRFSGRSSLGWSNNRRGKRSNHQQRRAKRSQHSSRKICGETPNEDADLLALTYAGTRGDSPSRVAFPAFVAEKMPPALAVDQGFPRAN